jgi:hypothetical protein
MSDINKTVASKTNKSQSEDVKYTMKELLESNSYARRGDRHNGQMERPIEVWNRFDELLLCDSTRPTSVKMPDNIPSPGTGEVHQLVNCQDEEVNSTKVKKSSSLVSGPNDKDPLNENNDCNKDIKVFVGKNLITDDEYMTIEDLWNLGWI